MSGPAFWWRHLLDAARKPTVAPPPPDNFEAPRRNVHTVFIHCSASDKPSHDDVSVIRRWHHARGWKDIGYHYYITKEGKVQHGRSLEWTPAAQKGHNRGTIAICCGGKQSFPPEQMEALVSLCKEINRELGGVRFRGHCEVSRKACPVFPYKAILNLTENGYMVEGAANA